MYFCNKCKKEFKNKKELYKGLCEKCYKEYLLNKIESIDDSETIEKKQKEISIISFIKKILKK